ncbi:hypothetical protein GCK72_022097 [Caenorhabditis remanei]|uniref:Uncharacterized protein n=1 Tax=Caenorhabditis remanei TaxID=31234 RepID=A0A6A5FSU4_CAERE|nr:hypothetical protein GCK72_022097 [Caenorhabditis remanei]KAF1745650.1 hypothetical protein GCK72_022097 [Caenorhabditis remanei]
MKPSHESSTTFTPPFQKIQVHNVNQYKKLDAGCFHTLHKFDTDSRCIILEEIRRLEKSGANRTEMFSKAAIAVYKRIGKLLTVNDVKNVEKTAIIILRNRLKAAIESEMSDEETEEHLKDWCYYHVISHKRKDLKNFVRKVKMKHEIAKYGKIKEVTSKNAQRPTQQISIDSLFSSHSTPNWPPPTCHEYFHPTNEYLSPIPPTQSIFNFDYSTAMSSNCSCCNKWNDTSLIPLPSVQYHYQNLTPVENQLGYEYNNSRPDYRQSYAFYEQQLISRPFFGKAGHIELDGKVHLAGDQNIFEDPSTDEEKWYHDLDQKWFGQKYFE